MKINKPIRLFWRENYSAKPNKVKEAIEIAIKESVETINAYPGRLYEEIVDLIADTLKINSKQITLSHGIEGLIHLAALTFLDNQKVAGMLEPSFFSCDINLGRYKHVKIPCHYSRKLSLNDLVKKIKMTDLFLLASPNTATGNYLLDLNEIESVLKKYKGIFIVDECYFGLGDKTALSLVNNYDNLLLLRGVTKVMGLGSLRLGFAIANEKIIDKLNYNLKDVEYDPIDTFSLNIFKRAFPYFDLLAKNSRNFLAEFSDYLKTQFPDDKFFKTVVTFYFMDIRRYKIPTYKVINYMNNNGYLMTPNDLKDNSSINFPEFIELVPPPRQYWEDFVAILKGALSQKE